MSYGKEEVTHWVKTYTKELYQFAESRISNREIIDDILQNTFLAAFEGYSKFEGKSNPKTWLFAILKNKIADYFREKYKKSKIQEQFDPLEVCFDKYGSWEPCHRPTDWAIEEQELLDNPDFNLILKGCFEKLPAKWASAIQLKYLSETTSKSICENLGITLANYWQTIHRARVMLRFCIESNWFKTGADH